MKNRKQINIAIPLDVHQRMKRESDVRGMKLREYPQFLMELVEVTTTEQQSAAYSRFVNSRSQPRRRATA